MVYRCLDAKGGEHPCPNAAKHMKPIKNCQNTGENGCCNKGQNEGQDMDATFDGRVAFGSLKPNGKIIGCDSEFSTDLGFKFYLHKLTDQCLMRTKATAHPKKPCNAALGKYVRRDCGFLRLPDLNQDEDD